MSSKHLRGDINYAWPTAEVAVMGAKVSDNELVFNRKFRALWVSYSAKPSPRMWSSTRRNTLTYSAIRSLPLLEASSTTSSSRGPLVDESAKIWSFSSPRNWRTPRRNMETFPSKQLSYLYIVLRSLFFDMRFCCFIVVSHFLVCHIVSLVVILFTICALQ